MGREMNELQWHIEWRDPNTLIPYENNAKLHDGKNISNIATSIKRYGWQSYLVITKAGVIIIGHGRRLAAIELGCKCPCKVVEDDLTDAEIRELRNVDNLTQDGKYDWDSLKVELDDFELDFGDFDFDNVPDEIPGEVSDTTTAAEDDFDPDEPVEPNAKLGDIYQLGRHRLMCGDSTDINAVERLMDGNKSRMVFTDPPWNVNYGAEENHPSWKPRTILNDFMGTDDFKQFMNSAFHCMNAVSEPGCMTYVVMSAQEWGNMMLTLASNDYHWSSTIIWNKDQLVLSRKDYHTKYEPIWYGWKDGSARLHPLDDRKQCDVWDFERPKVSIEHPTMKPVALVAQAIKNSSNSGDNVLDLFGGSGTTLIAAEQLGRRCYMMELDPHYVDVIIARWEKLTGDKAILLNE